MRALVVDHQAPGHLKLAEVPEPEQRPGELLVAVEAFSLNRGELPNKTSTPGAVLGWDAVGTVLRADLEGRGPGEGERVVTFAGSGAFAERRVAKVLDSAVLPSSVQSGQAATLGVAAVTALQAVRSVGSLVGRRLLVTGASGGVGHFAVQIGRLSGADVVALVGSPERGSSFEALGAAQVVTSLSGLEPVQAVIETVGGDQLVGAFGSLAGDGVCLSIGYASGQPAVFPPWATVNGNRRLVAFDMATPVGADLAVLAGLIAKGALVPEIGWRGDWTAAGEAVEALRQRRFQGKAVVTVT